MSQADELLTEKLHYSDYIGVEKLLLPYRVDLTTNKSTDADLEILADVYFAKPLTVTTSPLKIRHTELVEAIKNSVAAARSLDFESLAEQLAWDLNKIPATIAVYLNLVWRNPESKQGDWRISFWRVGKDIVTEIPELAEFVAIKPDVNKSVSAQTSTHLDDEDKNLAVSAKKSVQSWRGNRQKAEEKALDEIPIKPIKVVLALGGNLGDVKHTLQAAITDLQRHSGVGVSDISPLIRTKAVLMEGQEPQPDYYNAVVIIRCNLSARQLLALTQQIEAKYGRERKEKWGARTLDIDIITYGNVFSSIPDLTLPHPRAHQRAFVLLPWSMVEEKAELPGRGEIMLLMNYASDINGVLDIETQWFHSAKTDLDNTGENPLPCWNSLNEATHDIRIVDLLDDEDSIPVLNGISESDCSNMDLMGEDENLEESKKLEKTLEHNLNSEIDLEEKLSFTVAENNPDEQLPLETDNEICAGSEPEKSTGFWGALKAIFRRNSKIAEPEYDTNQEISPEDFFTLIESENAVKEQQILQGRAFTDLVSEMNRSSIPTSEKSDTDKTELEANIVNKSEESETKHTVGESKNNHEAEVDKTGFPPDTGEIPIQKIVEATDTAQQYQLNRRSVLRPSGTGPTVIEPAGENPEKGC